MISYCAGTLARNGLRYAPAGHRWAGVDSAWEQKKLEASVSTARQPKNA